MKKEVKKIFEEALSNEEFNNVCEEQMKDYFYKPWADKWDWESVVEINLYVSLYLGYLIWKWEYNQNKYLN